MEDTTANIYYEAHYKKLGDSAWTEVDTANKFKTSPTTTRYLKVTVNPVSTHMKFKFVAKTNSATVTPKLLGYDVRAILYPSKRKIIQCVVRGVDQPLLKPLAGGMKDDITAAHIKTVLDEANVATWPVTFYDPWNTTKTVKFLPMREVMEENGKDRNIERHFYLTLQEVTLS